MSSVIAAPELMAETATDLATISSMLSAHMAAATPTVAVMLTAADEVSASIAHLFSLHAQDYRALACGQAVETHRVSTVCSGEPVSAQTGIGAAGCPEIHGFNPRILREGRILKT